jgi:autotransporter adhesin
MSEESIHPIHETETPRWVGLAVGILAVLSLVALGIGWSASYRSGANDQNLSTQVQTAKQNEDVLSQRLAKSEDLNAQIQGELSVVGDKLKLTQQDAARARAQAKKIQEEDAKELADVQNNVNGQLATKAEVDDLDKVNGDVSGVRTDLESTKDKLELTRGEYGTLIARNHDDIEALRRLGERDYYEFTINKKDGHQKVGDVMVELRGTNTKKNMYSVVLSADDKNYDKKNRSVNEPMYFFENGSRKPVEFVVNSVSKDKITGYLSVPKPTPSTAQNSSGS